ADARDCASAKRQARELHVGGWGLRGGLGRRCGWADVLFMRHFGDRGDLVALVEVHDADALGVAADDPDLADVGAVDHALGGDEHDVVGLANRGDADHRTVALAGADIAQALAAAALLAIAHARAIFGGFPFRRWGGFLGRRLRLLGSFF